MRRSPSESEKSPPSPPLQRGELRDPAPSIHPIRSFDLPDRLELGEGVAFVSGRPELPWVSVAERPLVILFGTTGVGKSTVLATMADLGCRWRELPDRRSLTGRLVVGPQRRAEGLDEKRLARLDRYRYVRSFREAFPGGMSALLRGLAVDRKRWPGTLVFDGLRGRAEAEYAIRHFPEARFLILACPDFIRLKRLLERRDPHDRSSPEGEDSSLPASFAEIAPMELRSRFSAGEQAELLEAVHTGCFEVSDVRTKLEILAQDLRTHDPDGTRSLLESECGERALIVDTSTTPPDEVGQAVLGWMGDSGRRGREGGDRE